MFDTINTILDGIRNASRTAILRITANAMVPSPTYQDLKRTMKDHTIWTIWNKLYEETKPYLSASIRNATANTQPPDVQDALFAIRVSNSLREHRPLRHFNDYVEGIIDTIQRNITSIDPCSTSVRRLKELGDQYVKDSYEYMWNERSFLTLDSDLPARINDQGYEHYVSTQAIQDTIFLRDDQHAYRSSDPFGKLALNLIRLGKVIKSSELDNSVRRFIVNQGPGSAGMYFHEELAFLHMTPFFSGSSEYWIPEQLLQHNRNIFDDDDTSGDVDDEYQQHLEERFRRQFVAPTMPTSFRPNLFRSRAATPSHSVPASPPPGTSGQGGTPSTSNQGQRGSRSSRPRRPTHTQSSPGSSSAPAPASATPIPDDTTYTPDPLLNRLARDAIEYVTALPPTDLTNDHMTRFNTTTESSQAISRDYLRQEDQRIVVRDRYGSHTYLVTFTRAHRKPIFSLVT